MIDIKQIESWHEHNEHEMIVKTIISIQEIQRSYELTGWLARAYNNLGKYKDALGQLLLIPEGDSRDGVWHYRAGYACIHMGAYGQALQMFQAAERFIPEDEDIQNFISYASKKLEREKSNTRLSEAARTRLQEERKSKQGSEHIPFFGFDLSSFWEDSDYARQDYVSEPPTEEEIQVIEQELGYRLPQSYIFLMRGQNGGVPNPTCFPTELSTGWADNHIAISGISGIGRDKSYSLGGDLGSRFMIEEWGYPDIGIVICDCPSAGHDVVMLDYRQCGPEGEPQVIHVDQENNYEITFLAPDFESFITGLVNDEMYDTSEEDKLAALDMVDNGMFSSLFSQLCNAVTEVTHVERSIREICRQIVEQKGFFALHADDASMLMYDLQFWLYTKSNPDTTEEHYLDIYSQMIAFGGAFSTGGYAPAFVADWLKARMKAGAIVSERGAIFFTEEASFDVIRQLKAY